ncbi:MAG: Gfo/Idh/MocA family oxidoreductase [Lentisphaerae bacterium]|jgi:predicted dehydrogenase|nr:Gfo/Idh/MocA family oxidoreductase [Lentisphaerota bacterium]
MNCKTIKFGVIGAGLMGREFASAAARWCHLVDFKGARPKIVGVCDSNASLFDWFTSNFDSVTQTTGDYRELLANPEIDAIYCAVPHNLHEQMYVDIIDSGKHLLGEKPFGIDLEACESILAAVRLHPDQVVRCSSQITFFPAAQKIFEFIKDKKFGKIVEVECGFLHSSDMDPEKPINWKRVLATNGEYGCMGDLGMHVFHMPLRVGWMPKNVRAILSNLVPVRKNRDGATVPCETWDNATLFCEVENEGESFPMIAKMFRIAPGEMNTWYLTVKGTDFSASFSTRHPKTLSVLEYDRSKPQAWQQMDVGYESRYKTITGGIFEFGFPDAILQMWASFCEQISVGNDTPLSFGCATPEEALQSHKIFTAALVSQKEDKVVDLV